MMQTKRINLKVPQEVYAWIQFQSKYKGISMTEFINRILEKVIEEEKVNAPKQY